MIYLLYLIAAIMIIATQILYYNESFRNSPNYFFWGLVINVIMVSCWLKLVKLFGERQGIYSGAIYWDVMYFIIGYGMPLVWFGVKLNWMTALGILFVIMGITIVHLNFPR